MINDPNNNSDSTGVQTAFRKLRLFSRGSRHFGIFEDDIATTADWRAPAPLPHAPESVMGVVSIQGRMLTVLDLARIATREAEAETPQDNNWAHQILALRGDEQLALVIDAPGETIELPVQALESKSEVESLVLAVFKRGETEISILDTKQLFPSAIQGRERRRRRF